MAVVLLVSVGGSGTMWAGFSSLPCLVLSTSRHKKAFVRTTTTVLGLVECAPSASREYATSAASERDAVSGERSLLCLVVPSPRLPARSRSAGSCGIASAVLHVVAVSTVISLAAWSRSSAPHPVNATADGPQVPRLVFLLQPGPGGGGGGGGNRRAQPPSRAQAIGRDRLTVPVVRRQTDTLHATRRRRANNRSCSMPSRWRQEPR